MINPMVVEGQTRWFPEPKLLAPKQPANEEERRTLLLALHQARVMSIRVTDDAEYAPRLDELARANGGDPSAERCGVVEN
jgi:hypothetical protein